MNDDMHHDAELQAFAERLASRRPPISPEDRNAMIYASAFASGRKYAARSLVLWRTTTAALSLLLAGVIAFPKPVPPQVAKQPEKEPAAKIAVAPSQASDELLIQSLQQEKATVNLDAWQLPPRDDPLSKQLAEWSNRDPHLRATSVSSLTRTFLSSDQPNSL